MPPADVLKSLDQFKDVNDTYGHSGGDLILEAAGNVLRQAARAEDLPEATSSPCC